MISRTDQTRPPTRRHAARLLQQARRSPQARRLELAQWACHWLPESRPALRLYVQALLDEGDLAEADALIARARRRWREDPSLTLLAARSQFLQGRWLDAEALAVPALAARPRHIASLVLTGRVAGHLGRHEQAIEHLQRARHLRPHDPSLGAELVGALLEAGQLRWAWHELQRMRSRPVLLEAQVLQARGRVLDALDLVEAALRDDPAGPLGDLLLARRIDLLEACGAVDDLLKLETHLTADQPQALTRMAVSLLSSGRFDRAIPMMQQLADRPGHSRTALHVLIAAAACGGDMPTARRALERLRTSGPGIDPALMADCWARAIAGRVIERHSAGSAAGQGGTASVLLPLLEDAVATLDADLGRLDGAEDAGPWTRLVCDRAVCLTALGRTRAAAAITPQPQAPVHGESPAPRPRPPDAGSSHPIRRAA